MWLLSVVAVLLVTATFHSNAEFADLVVQTSSGTVKGWERVSRDGRVYQAWTGIPYGEPPVKELRFMPPKPKSPWGGLLNATGEAPSCLQRGMGSFEMNGVEDCLYLNVYRPKIEKENMPVLVHVHGGAFQTGNMGPRENADFLMDEDVVLVGLQYRLNAFGFMTLGDAVMPGNFGLKDQVLALKWVQENIVHFGGNPRSVTVFGESAGGMSTHILLKSPATDDLVHRAVSISGAISRFASELKSDLPRINTLSIAKMCGCLSENSREILECLQNVDAKQILSSLMSHVVDPANELFMPVMEPEDAEDPVMTSDLSLRPTKKPWMTSTCPGEWIVFRMILGNKPFPADMREYLTSYISSLPISMSKTHVLGAAEILNRFYFSNKSELTVNGVSKLEADMTFIYPAMANIAIHKGPKWIFRYEHLTEIAKIRNEMVNITDPIAPHASAGDSYLNLRSTMPGIGPVETPEDYSVSKRMIKYMMNFVNHDDPTPESSPFKWKQFKDSEILRVTTLGDLFADEKALKELNDVYTLWDTAVGWKNQPIY